MCFHNSIGKDAGELARRYGKSADRVRGFIPSHHISAFNFPLCPVITRGGEIESFSWGLIPAWTRTLDDAREIRLYNLNARAETIFTKRSFRDPIMSMRCLVPSTGWFDWRHGPRRRDPFFIKVRGEEIFSLAGIYDRWHDTATGLAYGTFSVITTVSDGFSFLPGKKQRMPVIIPREGEQAWLDAHQGRAEIEKFFLPFDTAMLEEYPVCNDFLRMNPREEAVIEPA